MKPAKVKVQIMSGSLSTSTDANPQCHISSDAVPDRAAVPISSDAVPISSDAVPMGPSFLERAAGALDQEYTRIFDLRNIVEDDAASSATSASEHAEPAAKRLKSDEAQADATSLLLGAASEIR
jgi:hypothetical protein